VANTHAKKKLDGTHIKPDTDNIKRDSNREKKIDRVAKHPHFISKYHDLALHEDDHEAQK
jgi:hypothetical protein